ncbi:MAG TPA: ROK family protein [Candidatus Coprousia avicola]|nr:ROK family protein [Candidatus Coprousia avicola]
MKQFFGIDVGGTEVKWAIMDEDFHFVGERGSIKTDFSSADEAVDAFASLVEPYRDQVAAIGMSVPGSIMEDDPDGTVHRGGALTYMDQCPLAKIMRERFGMPVAVNNDGKCAALGEYAAGALKGTRFGVTIGIGTGIAGGIVIDGKALRGAHCFAGEFSFLNNNCNQPVAFENIWANTASWKALRAYIFAEKGQEVDEAVDGRIFFKWIEDGDKEAQAGLDRYALAFDNWLINLQAVLDPEVFAIGGGISCHPELFEALERQMDTALGGFTGMLAGFPRPVIKRAQLGNDANIYGAVLEAKRLVEA